MRLTIATTAAFLLLLTGCEPAPTELRIETEQIVVHAVLLEGATTATVLLFRMEPLAPTGRMVGVPVHGATVQLSAGADTVTLAQHGAIGSCMQYVWQPETDLDAMCYGGPVPGGIRAGADYQLRIRLPNGRLITGSTTVPTAALLLEPGDGATFTARRSGSPSSVGDTVQARWPALPTWQRTELFATVARSDCQVLLQFGDQFGRFLEVSDRTSVQLVPTVGCADGQWPDSMPAEIALAVYDENYSRYVANGPVSSSVHHSDAAAGIEGAHGVFGATAHARRSVTLALPPAQ